MFRIDHDTGRIYTRAVPACCEVIYELTVEAKDEGIPPRSTTVTVTVISPKADRVNHVSTEANSGNNIPTKSQRSHQVRTKTDGHRQLHTKTDGHRQLHTKTDEYPTTSHVGNQGGHNGDKGYPGHAARSGHESKF